MCDLAVAVESAKFAMPGVNIGVFCSTPAVGVARNIGRKRAMEMLITGTPIDAKTALDWGLVIEVVPADMLDAEVERFVEAVLRAALPPSTGQAGVLPPDRSLSRSGLRHRQRDHGLQLDVGGRRRRDGRVSREAASDLARPMRCSTAEILLFLRNA